MLVNTENFEKIKADLDEKMALLVAVSKIKPVEAITELYELGHRDFGENYVQEIVDKQAQLPKDVRWHFIGHLQSNKVKYIAPFIHLIHGVDSFKLLKEINKQGQKIGRVIDVLLQVHIAKEESKFGFDESDIKQLLHENGSSELEGLGHIRIKGLMGMATFTEDEEVVRSEFRTLKQMFDQFAQTEKANFGMQILSMGMSGDYKIALEEGSNLVRIGSLLFGSRSKPA